MPCAANALPTLLAATRWHANIDMCKSRCWLVEAGYADLLLEPDQPAEQMTV